MDDTADRTHPFHVPGTSDVSPKLQLPTDQLVAYLQEKHRLKQEGEGLILKQFRHGQSNPTYYLSYGGQEMVLRKKPVRREKYGGREGEGGEGGEGGKGEGGGEGGEERKRRGRGEGGEGGRESI